MIRLENKADATICTIRVPMDEASRYGILDVNDQYRVTDFIEKPANPPSNLASMGVYVFNTEVLSRMLEEDADLTASNHDFGKDIIPRVIESYRVFAYPFRDVQSGVRLDQSPEAYPDIKVARFSPDGKWIAFLSFPKDIDPKDHPYYKPVYHRLLPVEGGVPKVIAYIYGGQGTINVPSWSPDSQRLAFVSNTVPFNTLIDG